MPFERGLQGAIVRYLNTQPKTVARVNSAGPGHVNGDPDVYGCHNGIMFHLEVKNETGRLTQIQSHRHDEWRKAGAQVFVVRSMDEARDAWTDVACLASEHGLE